MQTAEDSVAQSFFQQLFTVLLSSFTGNGHDFVNDNVTS